MASTTWRNKTSLLVHLPFSQQIRYPHTNTSPFVRVFGISILLQGTQSESHLPVQQLRVWQISTWAIKLVKPARQPRTNCCQASIRWVQHQVSTHPWERIWRSPALLKEGSHILLRKKDKKKDTGRRKMAEAGVKKTSPILSHAQWGADLCLFSYQAKRWHWGRAWLLQLGGRWLGKPISIHQYLKY